MSDDLDNDYPEKKVWDWRHRVSDLTDELRYAQERLEHWREVVRSGGAQEAAKNVGKEQKG